ncbi:MAG: alpha/beta hydrolase [Saprospiraceae bacterium]|nr:alpha/beta hydrolase [Saprospiraceae bacterium]
MYLLYLVLLGYCIFSLLFYLGQDFFFFRPERLPTNFKYRYSFPFEELHFDMEDGGYINGIYFRVPNAKGVVFYFKGNSKSIKGWGKFARDFVGKGYDFFMIDYRGFGKSKGKRSEASLYSDGQHVYKWLSKRYNEENIIVYGRSLGSGLATRIASWNDPKMLILDSPYLSFYHLVKRYAFLLPLKWILKYQFRTDLFIKKVTCPIFILHGNKDKLIPYQHSLELVEIAGPNAHLLTIEGGKHNDLPTFASYHDYLYDIMNQEGVYLTAMAKA